MQKYEMLILLKSDLDEETREAELKKYADIVTSMKGTVESTDKWGVKKTAYPIAFTQEAFYALMTFIGSGDIVKELDRIAGISTYVVRRVITKVKEN